MLQLLDLGQYRKTKMGLRAMVGFLATVSIVVVTVYSASSHARAFAPRGHRTIKRSLARPDTPSGVFQSAAVASDSQVCSDFASDVLKRNGSAVDAAIVGELCLGLYVPQSMGLGGGFFMTIYDKRNSKAVVIDGRETAPEAATENMYHGNSSWSEKGALAIGVPGQMRGLQVAYQLYGRLPWSDLFAPIINQCYTGVEVGWSLAGALQSAKDQVLADPGLRQVFVDPNTGDVYKQGDVYINQQLCKTMETISAEGVDVLYTGQLAEDLVNEIQQLGGIITLSDMANYSALVKDPTVAQLSGGISLYGPPPPASGAILSNILLILDGYHFNASDQDSVDTDTLVQHRTTEAFKFAYAKRTAMGDDQFVDMTGLVQNLTSPDYAAAIRSQIWDNRTFTADYYQPDFGVKEDHGTSHLAIIAPDGDAVGVTSTVNLFFGCGILSQSTGIILNDEMDDFSSPNITNYFGVPPSASNFIEPGKRPVSSTCPSIVTNQTGDVIMVVGGSGGTRITTAAALVFIQHVWLNDTVTKSVNMLRVHNQLYPQWTEYEKGYDQTILEGLRKKGHIMVPANESAITNTVGRTWDGQIEAHADFRKLGGVSGF